MYDSYKKFSILNKKLSYQKKNNNRFILATIHRRENIDNYENLSKIFNNLDKIFDKIEIQHMLDGHFKYRDIVNEQASLKIISNPNDIEARWTLSLLKILSNI